MRKRILVAEASDTTRRIAETVLRQNGFEVISVATADKAREVLQFARPDLIIVGGDLKGPDDQPFYEKLTGTPKTAAIPLMVFEPMEPVEMPFPPEVIIPQPFDPPDMLQRITAFTGQEGASALPPNPLSQLPDNDDFLDAALGLDRIDVTDSEVLDRANLTAKGISVTPNVERMVGYDHTEGETEEMSDSSRVESVMIRDEKTEKKKPSEVTGTNKLEIMRDQYGLADPESYKEQKGDDPSHDYDWFINSMRDEVGAPPGQKPMPPASKNPTEPIKARATGKVPMPEDPFSDVGLDTGRTPGTSGIGSKPRTAGVDKFIDEFKKEIEKIRSNEPDSIFVEETHSDGSDGGQQLFWEETLEKVAPEHVEVFTRQLASELAEKIAAKMVAKIDPDKLLRLIKAEVISHYKDKAR